MEEYFSHVLIYTQNVDDLHYQAGSKNVIEIHGNYRDLYCRECDYRKMVKNYVGLEIPPICPECQNMLRPDVILFAEMVPGKKLVRFAKELQKGFDAVFVIGTTCGFPHIQGPILKAKERDMLTIEINPDETWASDKVDFSVRDTASNALDKIWALYNDY